MFLQVSFPPRRLSYQTFAPFVRTIIADTLQNVDDIHPAMFFWRKKAIAWQGKKTTLHVHHAFLYISLQTLHDYHLKMPNFPFCEGRKQAMTKLYFSLWTWIWLIEIQLQKSSLAFDKASELE